MMNKNKIQRLVIFLMFAVMNGSVFAQTDPFSKTQNIKYFDFLNRVGTHNLGYAAEKYNLDIADLEVEAAKVFPDPEFNFGYADNGERRMQMGYGFEAGLAWTLELGGKRKARKNLALDQRNLAVLELQDYFQELRAESTIAFLETMQNKMLLDVQRDSYESMKQIAKSDSIRFSLGQISKVESVQSNLEAKSMWNEVSDAEIELETSLLELRALFAAEIKDSIYIPQGDFSKFDRIFNLEDLIITAHNNRSDFLVAKQERLVANSEILVAKANHATDIELSLGMESNSFVRNAVAPTPSHTAVSVGVTIPLRFSTRRDGELKTAYLQQKQAELNYKEVELALESEITMAYRNYLAKQKQLQQFEKGMLQDAKVVLDGIKYSYNRGASSLLEVLNAQRTYNETQQAYVEALFNYASALVELEKSAGIWDIEF